MGDQGAGRIPAGSAHLPVFVCAAALSRLLARFGGYSTAVQELDPHAELFSASSPASAVGAPGAVDEGAAAHVETPGEFISSMVLGVVTVGMLALFVWLVATS